MNNEGDPIWDRVVDDHRPLRRDLAAAERDLAGVAPFALTAETIDAMVARAVAVPTRATTGVPARRPLRRAVAAAALAVLFLSPLAWVGARVIWPEQQASSIVLTYATAIERAMHAELDVQRASAVSVIDDHCLAAIRALHAASSDADALVASCAIGARNELRRAWSTAPEAPRAPSIDIHETIRRLGDPTLATPKRVEAAEALVQGVLPGLAAMRLVQLDGELAKNLDEWLTRLRRKLQ